MSELQAAMIWCPFGSQEEAEAVCRQLVEERLVACANIIPQITSIFRFEGEVQSANEVGVVLKTSTSLLEQASNRLSQLHPYNTPAICGWSVDSAPEATREWLAAELVGGEKP